MEKTMVRGIASKVAVLVFAFAVSGAIAALGAHSAYAAEQLAAAQSNVLAESALTAQDAYSDYLYNYYDAKPSAIPANRPGMYEVYSTYFNLSIGVDSNLVNNTLTIQFRPKGGKWKTYTGMNYMQSYTFKGLRPNTKYQARLCYASRSGTSGNYSKAITFKTGPKKKVAVKSVRVQAINVSKHYQRIYGYYTGVYMGKRPYYTYKIRTTLYLKKAPKTKFIMVNGKKFKGNKKTYTVTTKKLVKYDSSPRGDKYYVTAYTFQNPKWKGYSLLYKKGFKLR